MSEAPEYVLGDTVASTIEQAKEYGLSLVAVNVALLEAVLEKLNQHASLQAENKRLREKIQDAVNLLEGRGQLDAARLVSMLLPKEGEG